MSLVVERHGDIHRLRMSSAAGRLAGIDVSAYVVRGVMIDTGFHHARVELLEAMSSLGVRGVVVTHWHEDHGGNVSLLASRGVPLLVRADTETVLRRRPDIKLYRRLIWGHPPRLRAPIEPFDGAGLACVHTPGHSPDHQAVWDAETGTLFSGDLWLGVRARVMHDAEDPYAIVESVRRAAALGPDRMFDAHRGVVDEPRTALAAKAEWLTEVIGEITRRVEEGWDDRTIVTRVLGGEERVAYVSGGEYSRRNLVRAVRRHESASS